MRDVAGAGMESVRKEIEAGESGFGCVDRGILTFRVRLHYAVAAAIILFLLLARVPRSGFAQYNTGEISGVVTDAQTGVLPGVTVTVIHAASGFRTERITDAEGRFRMRVPQAGGYTLIARVGSALQRRKVEIPEPSYDIAFSDSGV